MYHFIGIGGVGMAAVAELLAARGHEISGSDRAESANLDHLRALGVTCTVGHDAAAVDPSATVVRSSAISPDNPELTVAAERGQRIIHRSEALALAAADRRFIAVAGAHGKSTVSAMISHVLLESGQDPSWAFGATMKGSSGARLGAGDAFVAEADESDGSFLNYRPEIEVVTTIEPDHLDHYGSTEAFEEAFTRFADLRTGPLIACSDDPGARRLLERATGTRWAYGTEPYEGAETKIDLIMHTPRTASIRCAGERVNLTLLQPGEHNLRNACAAWAAARALGIDPEVAADALATFPGISRRMEVVGEKNGVRVIDDYAHHPSEVAATIDALRAENRRLLVLFQPHLYSRTRIFAERFAAALDTADEVIVTGVYGAREEPEEGVDGDLITRAMTRGRFIADRFEAADEIARSARDGDIVCTMGAGNVTELGRRILEAL
ncbi:MAG: UDP-N-acetylmuramate--L-alanine ligase [Flaviflexus sp.]|nr:UDP-N-acetylmuramate--L-alanine ligase [Flaviflexus sp.]